MIKERLKAWIKQRKHELQRGIEITQQQKAEKQRKKLRKAMESKPGTIRYGIYANQSPTEFMKELYDIKKQEREEKYGKKN
jgi:hypothetical protein